ncbi:thiol-activated cytolysin family protein [Tissierella sp. MB52-C2]|uniref:thiol-activated cytolysin family protein n=1 Tax=Tissierella sp. MB52-C2 TaxID=3070999 RepID=UPI00280C2AF5|nr:thiol-activated cytolysin family protein [Tissierella sp. MB52-C2]WMM26349.1 thiol-activated cytolysin family protein [Tissierella sp. MB52-C2]
MEKKSIKTKRLLICLLASLCIIQQPLSILAEEVQSSIGIQTDDINDIDEGVFNLNYNKNEVLASEGDTIESFIPREGNLIKDKFIVVERTKKTLNTTPVDISIIDSMTDRTYPGALQLANRDFIDNQPNLLACKRKPINISIDLPGMKSENTVNVQNPTYGNINGAIDDLIANWSEKYSPTHTLPARIQYSESMVYSKSQISSVLNANTKVITDSLGIDFDAISNGEKKVMVAAYKQIFYTVSAETPNNPSDLFDNSVTFRELTRKGVSDQTPPIMVSNVAYGRTIYVKLETTSKSNDVQAAFKALLSDASINAKSKYKDIFEESSFTAVVLGGDSKEHNKIITKDFDQIRNVIKDNSEWSPRNPAYPISYTSIFLKDNSVAAVHNKTDYVETRSTEYSSGKINIDHRGAYVAQFNISWDELSYDEDGNEILNHKTWDGNWADRTARFVSVIYLPANSTNIRIYVRECTGLAWEWWRTVIDEYNVPLTKEINVSIGGTTLSPTGSISHK